MPEMKGKESIFIKSIKDGINQDRFFSIKPLLIGLRGDQNVQSHLNGDLSSFDSFIHIQ